MDQKRWITLVWVITRSMAQSGGPQNNLSLPFISHTSLPSPISLIDSASGFIVYTSDIRHAAALVSPSPVIHVLKANKSAVIQDHSEQIIDLQLHSKFECPYLIY